MHRTTIFWVLVLGYLQGLGQFLGGNLNSSEFPPKGNVSFSTTDSAINQAFVWAKETALSYVHDQGDPVGPWYEAALPGREAFCMRDVAHQSLGAAILGLYAHNENMLFQFASHISESRDWCSLWEINKFGNPAPVDYRNDQDFWYNLPANFDVVDACYRQYLWTRKEIYIREPIFLHFYKRSVEEYVERWALDPAQVLTRDRKLNLRQPPVPSNSFFYTARGIPGYFEGGNKVMRMGVDLSAAQYAAYRAVSQFAAWNNDTYSAQNFKDKAREYKAFMDSLWWNPRTQNVRSLLYEDGSFQEAQGQDIQNFSHYLLYFRTIEDPKKIQRILDSFTPPQTGLNIELDTYLPELYYHFGEMEKASALIKHLASPQKQRREYPENPFAIISSLTLGYMGIIPDASKGLITTYSRIVDKSHEAEIKNLPVFSNEIQVQHRKGTETIFTNQSGGPVKWKACFLSDSKSLKINGKKHLAQQEKDIMGNTWSWLEVGVFPGQTIRISK